MLKKPPGFPDKPDVRNVKCLASQEKYLAALAECGSKGASASEAGISASTAEQWAHKDTYGFKTRQQDALAVFMGKVEREINRRAMDGVDKPLHYRGQIFATYKEFSDNLLMFRAKKLDPSYKDNWVPTEARPTSVTQINIHLHPSVSPNPLVDANTVIDSIPQPRHQDSLPQDLSTD